MDVLQPRIACRPFALESRSVSRPADRVLLQTLAGAMQQIGVALFPLLSHLMLVADLSRVSGSNCGQFLQETSSFYIAFKVNQREYLSASRVG